MQELDKSFNSFVLSGISVSGINIEESSLDGRYMVVSCTLSFNETSITTHALIDTGATGYAFMDKDFISTHNIPTIELKKPRTIEVIDGRKISSGNVAHLAHAILKIEKHTELTPFFITKLQYPLVLGIPWIKRHDITLGFCKHTISFKSNFCKNNCETNKQAISCLPKRKEEIHELPPPILISAMDLQSFQEMTRVKNLQLCAGWLNPEGHLETNAIQLNGID